MKYIQTHPWIKFALNTATFPARLWLSLGEARSKCDHLAGVPLRPKIAELLHQVYLAKGLLATAAIEGNTLTEEQVRARIEGKGTLPKSQEYLGKEIDNVLSAVNEILDTIEAEGPIPITTTQIRNYNRLILKGLELEEHVIPGEYSKVQVGVPDYKGVSPLESDALMEKLCNWLNGEDFKAKQDDAIVYGIIKSVVAHIYLAWIHPFGDGNGRTARLLEVRFLLEAGVPYAAIHLLSNHYNKTRTDYYRRLAEASKNGGDLTNFFQYAATGFLDLLREQLRTVKFQQWQIAWESYVYENFRGMDTVAARRQRILVLAMSQRDAISKGELRRLTPEVAECYANKTAKTLSRDINALLKMELITESGQNVRANSEIILAFLPRARAGDLESKHQEALRLRSEGGQLELPL